MGVSPLIDNNGKLVTDSKGKADVLNQQYQSVFTKEKTGTLPDIGESSIPSITDIIFTIPGIEKLLKGLDTSKSNGPDEIPLRILKEYAHQQLLLQLNHYGIRDKTCGWIRTWLTNRKQRLVVGGEKSEEACVKSGVPQGTVLGPLMFLLYINDIGDNVSKGTYI